MSAIRVGMVEFTFFAGSTSELPNL